QCSQGFESALGGEAVYARINRGWGASLAGRATRCCTGRLTPGGRREPVTLAGWRCGEIYSRRGAVSKSRGFKQYVASMTSRRLTIASTMEGQRFTSWKSSRPPGPLVAP